MRESAWLAVMKGAVKFALSLYLYLLMSQQPSLQMGFLEAKIVSSYVPSTENNNFQHGPLINTVL